VPIEPRAILGMIDPTRATAALSAVANAWFVVLWSASSPVESPTWTIPLWAALAAAALNASALYGFGAALNDLIDLHRDRVLHRDRPLVTGMVVPETAILGVAGALVAAFFGATAFGTGAVLMTAAVAAGILVFNAAGRFVPGAGLPLLAAIYAGQMLVPNPGLSFLLPVWLVATHALFAAGLSHRLARRTPAISRRATAFALVGWAVTTVGLGFLAWRRGGGSWWPAEVPPEAGVWAAAAVAVYAGLAWRRVARLGPGPRAAEKVARYGALWLTVYAAAWFFGADRTLGFWILAGVALVGFVGVALLREVQSLAEHPLGYRR
jgi:hypothetical protein